MGKFEAETNLGSNGVQRPYLREGDPHRVLQNAPKLYASHHGAGTRSYERNGPRGAAIRTLDGGVDPQDCYATIGWLQRAIELSGGRSVRVEETQCRARGESVCEFRCGWR